MSAIDLEIDGTGGKRFRSIESLTWKGIPPLVVLTGPNGSGKTQLLELLAYRLTGTVHPEFRDNLPNVRISGDTFGPESVAYVPSSWDISGDPSSQLSDLHNVKNQAISSVTQQGQQHDLTARVRRGRLAQLLGLHVDALNPRDLTLSNRLPDDLSFMLDDRDVTAGLVHVFLAYRVRVAEEREKGTAAADIRTNLGPPPWDVLNDTFNAAGFPFNVLSPAGTPLLSRYQLRFRDSRFGTDLRASDLSSGEKTILGIVIWLYNSSHFGRFPKLFLLDEPDAHLHPSMTQQFMDVVHDVLVRKYRVRVIMTTHSPSTVALAPPDSVFNMRRSGEPRISPSTSRAEAIGLLTSGLVTVSAGMRFVFVEDTDDVAFFEMVRDVLTDSGPSRDSKAIRLVPAISFLPVSLGSGKSKVSGGKNAVTQWIDKLDADPLAELFRGAIDHDGGNAEKPRIVVLGRYSIENYYLDPFVVYGVLSDQGTAPNLPGVPIPMGQEHLIRSLSAPELQAIVDAIAQRVEPLLSNLSASELMRLPVVFTNDRKVEYPKWMIERRGHDLMPVYQTAFGGPGVMSPPRLARSFRRVRLVPAELAALMTRLQAI